MCNWKSWIWPGLITTAVLTALTGWFLSGPVEQDLTARAGEALKASQPWSTVTFDGRDATISGVALSETEHTNAAKTTLDTSGVRFVSNTATLLAKADPFLLSLTKDATGVAIKGNYTTTESRSAIIAAAEKAMPGIAVKDELVQAAGEPAGFVALAAFGASQLADLTSGEVSLSNMDYSIKGATVDAASYDKLTADSALLPAGAKLKIAELAKPVIPEPTPAAPYFWTATSTVEGVKLEGSVPSVDVGAVAMDLAKRRFVKVEVSEAQTVLDGASEGFAEAQVNALKSLSYLSNGKATISDKTVTLEGAAPSQSVSSYVMEKAKAGMPSGFELVANISVVEPAVPASADVVALKPYVWTATSNAQGIKLEGSVLSIPVGQTILDAADASFPGRTITNAQAPLSPSPAGFASAQIAVLKGLAMLQEGNATITDKVVSLTGTAATEEEKSSAATAIGQGLPEGYVLTSDAIMIAPAPEPVVASVPAAASPYIWMASSRASGVKLDGSVSSAEVGKANVELAALRFVKTELADTQTVLEGAPEGFGDAQMASLKALSYLNEGRAIHSDKTVDLSGVAASEALKALVIRNAAASMPKEYSLTANISVAEIPAVAEVSAVAEVTAIAEVPAVAEVVTPAAATTNCMAGITALISNEKISFESNKAIILGASSALIGNIAKAMALCPEQKVEVAGHTDSDGDDAYNQRLANDRAFAVRNALKEAGVSGWRIKAKGYGETAPIVANDTEENKALNRRIEFRAIE